RAMAEAGSVARYGALTPQLKERIDKELTVIAKTGYTGYILIVQDFIRFAHERGILTAVRGSAGGSLVNYAIGLTDIDPLKYGLIFERFLNLERFTPPDIDVDFMGDRRDEVIQYVTQKYGADRVAQIGTFNTMLARAAVRDVARVLKFDFLGLGNLTILDHALRLIERERGTKIRREDIPLDDKRTFELLGSGETTGMFQLESAGMRRYIRELKPDRVEDVMAMVALFRPGPMDYIPTYIRRKHGEEPVTYAHPTLEPV